MLRTCTGKDQIRLLDRIGDSFGTFSPRNLAELGASEATLPPLIEPMTTCAERWNTALGAAEEKSFAGFVSGHPEWRARLEDKALQRLDAEGRRQIVAELLPEIERHVRDSPDLRDRIEGLRDRADEASEFRWRLEVRSAALRRMRAILLGVAGRTLLRGDANAEDGTAGRGETRSALEGLERCEAFEPGVLPPSRLVTGDPAVDRFPPLTDDLVSSWKRSSRPGSVSASSATAFSAFAVSCLHFAQPVPSTWILIPSLLTAPR